MIFYKKTFLFISILLLRTGLFHNKELSITGSGLTPASVCRIGLEFFTELNNTSSEDFHVELIPDECCLKGSEEDDCDSLQIIGECSEVIPKETTKMLTLVAPLIDPFERTGFCTVHVDSRPIDRRRRMIRETLNIHFDTRVKENNNTDTYYLQQCNNIDEDPLNECKPVNCETYYNGNKPYFDKFLKRCVEVPPCIDRKRNHSNQVYDPKNNKCIADESINDADIEFIKSLSAQDRHTKDILIIKTVNKLENYTNIPNRDEALNKINETLVLNAKSKIMCHPVVQYILTNKYTMLVLALVVILQCCLIITMIYCLTNNLSCCNKKKVVRKFFNYRQDASVTTPLIDTSNMDTETTEFDYISESSKIDKKIKCYKACQKEAKICMSDDILLKCLNRRDWNSKPKSEMIKDTAEFNLNTYKEQENDIKEKREEKSIKTEISRTETNSAVSEKEIRCHDYNVTQQKQEFDEIDHVNENKFKDSSLAAEKGAQASFSNDSIDDFLSERGMIFLGENSFTSTASPSRSSTELTSKTSKNNIIRNVLSYLSKSKKSTSSDPGCKARSKNLELLHISHASVYSTSSELKNIKSIKLVKESRSTF